MKKIYVLLLATALFYSCKKEDGGENVSGCALQMKEIFKEELKCFEQNVMEVNLYTGLYENEQVYFTKMMCINCNTVPPVYGYTCEKKKITFDDFKNVKDIKEVYNSCTEVFTE